MKMIWRGLAVALGGTWLMHTGYSAEESGGAAIILGGFMIYLGLGLAFSELRRMYYRRKAMTRLDDGTF